MRHGAILFAGGGVRVLAISGQAYSIWKATYTRLIGAGALDINRKILGRVGNNIGERRYLAERTFQIGSCWARNHSNIRESPGCADLACALVGWSSWQAARRRRAARRRQVRHQASARRLGTINTSIPLLFYTLLPKWAITINNTGAVHTQYKQYIHMQRPDDNGTPEQNELLMFLLLMLGARHLGRTHSHERPDWTDQLDGARAMGRLISHHDELIADQPSNFPRQADQQRAVRSSHKMLRLIGEPHWDAFTNNGNNAGSG